MKPAHVHLLSAAAAEASRWASEADFSKRRIRILDVGCGYGQLLVDLVEAWPRLGLELPEVEVYGFEVYDHRAGSPGYCAAVVSQLSRAVPAVEWADRIRFAAANEPWPFPDGFFDLCISNQVLEHVQDLQGFFGEERRVARPGGASLHFYPSEETWVEPHCGVPWAHRVDRARLRKWLRAWSRLGVGKFPGYRRSRGTTLEAFCEEFYRYLGRYVFFRSNRQISAWAAEGVSSSGFGYGRELVGRGLRDDWEPFPYRFQRRLSGRCGLARWGSCTLARRF
ncbi:class I SAM-dependent methyltransferase [Pelagicoccus sp. SDUM812005]|uniref:class I SAM-dependent methyltransferase n=1 Tax=Pelagicoccus sp. SDUM812005 TaxID=3041257 RepID=UPI00280E2EFF|nr:class I SAM-dependent methyltransferase [Pelagicoccus sp. SDUM812005]MDQ8179736.1 class I SAM-dependent methyltransferase [Pelagicoccus sp. SDUM812005]